MASDHKARAADEHPPRAYDEGAGGMNTGVAIIGFILCFFAGAGLMWGYDAHNGVAKGGSISADSAAGWADNDSPVPVDSKDPVWGKRDAPVTIVEFSDFQCPFCGRVEPTMKQVRDTYGPDKVRIIWKNEPLPFHNNAKPAAEAAQGVFALAGNDAFWKWHDTAFSNQQSLSTDSYVKWATDAGVKDVAKYKAGLDAHTWADKVDKDHAEAQKVGVNGTPAFFVNGVSISGAQPFDKFKAVIDQELQKAQAKIAAGTAKDKVYVAMSSANKQNAPANDDKDDEAKDDQTVFKVPVGNSPATWGGDKALVTIVEFSDFQCPFCKRVEDTLKKVHDTYGDKVRLVWKNEPLPFHPRAEPAAEVAMEARAEKGDKGFWDAHDKLFASQPKLDDPDLMQVAKDAGLSADKVADAMKNHKYKKDIDADADMADDLQASGTPHFFINGKRLVGAQPFEKFQKIIDAELAAAQAKVASGVPASAVYEAIIKDGKGAPAPEMKAMPSINGAPWKGAKPTKVTIVEFSDFQCPFCKRVEDTVKQVMTDYGDKVHFVWRNLPLPMHPDAPMAAEAAMEAYKQKGSDGFWKMHDLLYQNQGGDGLKRPALEGYAQQIGLDMTKFKNALDTDAHKAEIDADAKMGNDEGITGTPAFLIGNGAGGQGYYISGAQPYPKFKKLIEKALAGQ
jgi:protein-disulfide isomerase